MKKIILICSFLLAGVFSAQAAYMLLPMDAEQKDHLKAYGITYWILNAEIEAWWLLNYRGGSFAFRHNKAFEKECLTRGVSYEIIPDVQFNKILLDIANPEANMDAVKLEVAPKIAVYTPDVNEKGEKVQPWDDAGYSPMQRFPMMWSTIKKYWITNCQSTTGYICTMRISPGNMVGFTGPIILNPGTKKMSDGWKHLLLNWDLQKYLN